MYWTPPKASTFAAVFFRYLCQEHTTVGAGPTPGGDHAATLASYSTHHGRSKDKHASEEGYRVTMRSAVVLQPPERPWFA